jgi:hypothetical protein
MMSAQLQLQGQAQPQAPTLAALNGDAPPDQRPFAAAIIPDTAAEANAGNRVGGAVNPWVRSHGSDLVHWNFLDEIALARAQAENKLILMHIGYSACHC